MARLTTNSLAIFFLCILLGNEIANGAYRPNPKLLTRTRRSQEETERSPKEIEQISTFSPIIESESKENNLETLNNANENFNLFNTNTNIVNKNNTNQKFDLNNRGNLKYRNLKYPNEKLLQKNSEDINHTQFVKNVTLPKTVVQLTQTISSTAEPAVTEKDLETTRLDVVQSSNAKDQLSNSDLEMNIHKYTSSDFHDINNVYVQTSEDSTYVPNSNITNEEHLEPHEPPEYGSPILSTPKSEIFDSRYKQVQDSIKENIAEAETATEHVSENETEFDFDKLELSPSNNKTKVSFNVTKVSDLVYKDSINSGSNKKEYISANGTNINYESSYVKGDDNEVEETTETTSKSPERVVISLSSSLHPVIVNTSSVTEATTTESIKKSEITVREVFNSSTTDNQIQETVSDGITQVPRVQISLKTNNVEYQNTTEATTTRSTREQKSYYVSTSSPLDPTSQNHIETKSSNEITISQTTHTKRGSLKHVDDESISNDTANNMTLPSTAVVWALVGMKDVPPTKKAGISPTEISSNIKQLADWTEIVKTLNNSLDDSNGTTTVSQQIETTTTISIKENLAEGNHIYTVQVLPPVTESSSTEGTVEVTTEYEEDSTTSFEYTDETTTTENIDKKAFVSSEAPLKLDVVSETNLGDITSVETETTTEAIEVTTLLEPLNVTEENNSSAVDNLSNISLTTTLVDNEESTVNENNEEGNTTTESYSLVSSEDISSTEAENISATSESSSDIETTDKPSSSDTYPFETSNANEVSTLSNNVDIESATTIYLEEENITAKPNITETTSEYPSSTISVVEIITKPDTTPTPSDIEVSTEKPSSSESVTEITTPEPEDVSTTESFTTEVSNSVPSTTLLDDTVITTDQTLIDENTTMMAEDTNKNTQTDTFEDNVIILSSTSKPNEVIDAITTSGYTSQTVESTTKVNQTIPTTISSTKGPAIGLDTDFVDESSGSYEHEYDNGLTPDANAHTNITSNEDIVVAKISTTTSKYDEDNSINGNSGLGEKATETNNDLNNGIHLSTSAYPNPKAIFTTEFNKFTQDPNDIDYTDAVTKSDVTIETTTDFPQGMNRENPDNTGTIAAIVISVVGVIALVILVALLYVMRKRQKRMTYGQRCTPVSLDAYSLDSVSVYNSMRRKGVLRASKRSYGNPAFEDSGMTSHPMNFAALANFVSDAEAVKNEFLDIPQVTVRSDEIPPGCDVKNRYANVIPLPETRVHLKQIGEDTTSDYINANYVRGPKNSRNYYIACQAPMQSTVNDFWRMIWEEQSRLILMVTDLYENGVEKCVDYLPPSEVLDCHRLFGDFKITLKKREVKDKYVISSVHLRNMESGTWREITHIWYMWPEKGVPSECHSMIAFLIEARSFMKSSSTTNTTNSISPVLFDDSETIEENEVKEYNSAKSENKTNGIDKTAAENEKNINKSENNDIKTNVKDIKNEKNGKTAETKEKKTNKTNSGDNMPNMGPVVVHCSPGTGRTGTVIACDLGIREFELTRMVDIPKTVYRVRRDRASAVQTKEQYAFIYEVLNLYATKLTGGILDSI